MNHDRREQLLNEPYVQEILKRLQEAEQAKQELEEQLAIVNALAWDHYTVYDVNLQTSNFRSVQVGTHRSSSGSGKPVWHIQKEIKEKEQESAYRSQLFEFSFTFLAENTDDLYIILDHVTEELEYASPNLDRVLGVAPDELIGYLRTGDMAVDAEGASAYYSKLRVCIQARWRSRGVRSGSTPKPVNTSIFWRMFTALTFRAVKSGYDRRNLFEGGRAWHVFVMYSRGKGMVAKLCVEKNSTCADHHPQKSYCPP